MSGTIKNLLKTGILFAAVIIAASGAQAQRDSGSWNGNGGGNGNGNSNNCNATGNNGGGYEGDDRDDDRYGKALRIVGLTSTQKLICFSEFNPGNATVIGTVSGLTGGDSVLIGIDFRVQDGNLYGVGNAGGVYILNRTTAAATLVNRLSVALSGTSFGVDFNPAADRLRIISDNGQNLRHNVNAGGVTINDGTLSYTAPATTTALGVTGAAYTNNDLDVNTATTLYDVDSTLDQVAIQSPANNGTLVATGKLTIDTTSGVGFDIYSTIRNGSTVNVEGFATLTSAADGVIRLYSIALFSGKATNRGSFNTSNQVIDIAIPLGQR